jgi:hypothetical protein
MSLTVEWQGAAYAVPPLEPPQDRNLDGLHALFRRALEPYVAFAQGFTTLEVRIGECRRTEARQAWLYAQGRVNGASVRSWTLDSKHRYGLASDLILVDPATKAAVWDDHVWRQLYADAPPQWFGLTPISKELVHLEHAHAAQLIDRAEELGLIRT